MLIRFLKTFKKIESVCAAWKCLLRVTSWIRLVLWIKGTIHEATELNTKIDTKLVNANCL